MIDGANLETAHIDDQTPGIFMTMDHPIESHLTEFRGILFSQVVFSIIHKKKRIHYPIIIRMRRNPFLAYQEIIEALLIHIIDKINTMRSDHTCHMGCQGGMYKQRIIDMLGDLDLTDVGKHSHPFGSISHDTQSRRSAVSYPFHISGGRFHIEAQIVTREFYDTHSLLSELSIGKGVLSSILFFLYSILFIFFESRSYSSLG